MHDITFGETDRSSLPLTSLGSLTPSAPFLYPLPKEIILHIFSFLSALDLTQSVSLSNRHALTLARDELLWKKLFQSTWPLSTPHQSSSTSWYLQYSTQYQVLVNQIETDFDKAVTLIKDYNIQDEGVRIAMAKRSAKKDGALLSLFIKDYAIQDEGSRLEIAKLAIRQNPKGASVLIENYAILSEKVRTEIATLAEQLIEQQQEETDALSTNPIDALYMAQLAELSALNIDL